MTKEANDHSDTTFPMVRIVAYGQCGEDVVLDRIFRDVESGFYVDAGAGHPVTGSITKNLADLGWRGIDIEPNPSLAGLLRAHRPNSSVFWGAVSSHKGVTTFQPDADWARSQTGVGGISVPCDTLHGFMEAHASPGFELLKIDIEGDELEAFDGMNLCYWRPQVVLAETHHCRDLEQMISRCGYTPCLFDGINRFFVRDDLPHLAERAQYGPTPADYHIPAIWLNLLKEDARRRIMDEPVDTIDIPDYPLRLDPVDLTHLPLLQAWYSDPEAVNNLYRAPNDSTEFAKYMLRPHRFIAFSGDVPVGTCHIEQHDHMGVVGILVDARFRHNGFGRSILMLAEAAAAEHGMRVMAADIYSDNTDAIRVFKRCGYREFVWVEKNLDP